MHARTTAFQCDKRYRSDIHISATTPPRRSIVHGQQQPRYTDTSITYLSWYGIDLEEPASRTDVGR